MVADHTSDALGSSARKGRRLMIFLIVGAVVLIAIAVILVLVLAGGNPTDMPTGR